ncbi:hypothetical protein HMI55_005510 [Coelomomyces lativittatus]|nr:hypothetical protein HMI55_005510 [Coelomomyces lativittatus]
MKAIIFLCALFYLVCFGIGNTMLDIVEAEVKGAPHLKNKYLFYEYAYITDIRHDEENCKRTCNVIFFKDCSYKPKFLLEPKGIQLTLFQNENYTKIKENRFRIYPAKNDLSANSVNGCYCQKSRTKKLNFLGES